MNFPCLRATLLFTLMLSAACGDDDAGADAAPDAAPDATMDAGASDVTTPDTNGDAPESDAGPVDPYRTVPCMDVVGAAADGMTCGFVRVPQNRVRETGRDIELFFVRPTEAPDGDEPPVVVLAGGPGSSHGGFAARLNLPLEMSEALGREVIYFDQRGVPASSPDTLCPELDEAESTSEEIAALSVCNARYVADDIDIHSYNTIENAADIAALPAALGVPQIDLIAGSYGTRLGLRVLERHPEAIRRVVLGGLDVPGGTEYNPGTPDFGALIGQATTYFAEECAMDPECNALIPAFNVSTILMQLDAIIARDGSVEIAGIPFASAEQIGGVLFSMMYVSQVRNLFFGALYHAANETTPTFLAHVGEGDADAGLMFVRRLLQSAQQAVFGGSSGMSAATRCYDGSEPWCTVIGGRMDDYPPAEFQSLDGTDHPILMVSGALDPATPTRDVAPILPTYPNAVHTVFPCLGHDISRISNRANGTCVIEQARSFLDDPTATPPNCVETLCDALPLAPTRSDLLEVVREYVEDFPE